MDLESLAVEYVGFIESVREASVPGSGVSLMGEYGALTGAVAILGRVNTLRRLGENGQRHERWERFEWLVGQERERRAAAADYAERYGSIAEARNEPESGADELTCRRCGDPAPCRCWPTLQRRGIKRLLDERAAPRKRPEPDDDDPVCPACGCDPCWCEIRDARAAHRAELT